MQQLDLGKPNQVLSASRVTEIETEENELKDFAFKTNSHHLKHKNAMNMDKLQNIINVSKLQDETLLVSSSLTSQKRETIVKDSDN